MKICIRAHDLDVKGTEAILDRLNVFGIDGVQMVCYKAYPDIPYEPGAITAEKATAIGAAFRDAGRMIPLVGAYFNPVHPNREKAERCEKIFDEAEKIASSDEILHRIRKQRLAVRYLRILLTPKGSEERNRLIDAFESDARAYGLTMIWERRDINFCLNVLRGKEDPGYWWTK